MLADTCNAGGSSTKVTCPAGDNQSCPSLATGLTCTVDGESAFLLLLLLSADHSTDLAPNILYNITLIQLA